MVLLLFSPALGAGIGRIDARELARDSAKWVVLDGRPLARWREGRIPGSRSFSWENYTRTDEKGVQFKIRPPRELAEALGALGIDRKTPVVVYGDADSSWGGEGWIAWVLGWLGHAGEIRILDGGIQSWQAAGFPLAKGPEPVKGTPVNFRLDLQPQLDISTEELKKNLGNLVLVDTRSTWERLRGRIPGSVHISWKDFFSGRERRPLSSAALKKLLVGHGVDLRKPVVYYCTGGIRSGFAWMVHELAGLPAARNYEGGMEEWKKFESR